MSANQKASIEYIDANWNGEYIDCAGSKLYPYPAVCGTLDYALKYLVSSEWAYFISENGDIQGSLMPIVLQPYPHIFPTITRY